MVDSRDGWPLWACIALTEAMIAIPFMFVLGKPWWALIGWVCVSALYVNSLAVFGKGHVIEGALAAVILAVLVAIVMLRLQ